MNKKKDDTIFIIGALTFVVLLAIAIGGLIITGKIDIKSKISGMTSAISAKKTEMAGQVKAGAQQMKAQIAKAVSGETITATVSFKVGEYALEQSEHTKLERIRDLCMKNKALRISIQGFADPSGSAVQNVALSMKRTAAVQRYFEYLGCHNIEDGGFGSKIPERQVVVTATN